jgi:hypothetical protein
MASSCTPDRVYCDKSVLRVKRGEQLVARLLQKVLLLVMALAMLAASMPGVAGAAAKKDSTKGKNAGFTSIVGPGSAKGKGVDDVGKPFKFSAKSTKGSDTLTHAAKGKAHLQIGGMAFNGKVQCLEVTSDGAADLRGKITKTNTPSVKGEYIVFEAFDSGQPKGAGDTLTSYIDPSATCAPSTNTAGPLRSGNIVVHAKNTLP